MQIFSVDIMEIINFPMLYFFSSLVEITSKFFEPSIHVCFGFMKEERQTFNNYAHMKIAEYNKDELHIYYMTCNPYKCKYINLKYPSSTDNSLFQQL